jgi:hypothetical protein
LAIIALNRSLLCETMTVGRFSETCDFIVISLAPFVAFGHPVAHALTGSVFSVKRCAGDERFGLIERHAIRIPGGGKR